MAQLNFEWTGRLARMWSDMELRAWLRELWRTSEPRPQLIALCIRDRAGLSADACARLESAISAAAPDWSAFLPPHAFMVFFRADQSGAERAGRLAGEIAALAAAEPAFAGLRLGRAQGRATVTYGANGRLETMPLGGFVNDALSQATIQ